MWDRLGEIVREASADSTLRGMVVAGGPEAFAAGADIAEFKAFRDAEDGFVYEARVEAVLRAIEDLDVPTIAALAGACTGGGVFLASACDLRVAAPNLRAGVPIARTLGNVTTVANVRRLGALIGLGRVKEWFMTARLLDAQGALAAGFVGEVVPSYADLAPRAQALAEELAGFAPRTLRASKELYRRILRAGEPLEERDILTSCYTSADFHEGVAAFFEKRRPQWRDR
jgi:enoyl-CoA hydratase/carnithine racemase